MGYDSGKLIESVEGIVEFADCDAQVNGSPQRLVQCTTVTTPLFMCGWWVHMYLYVPTCKKVVEKVPVVWSCGELAGSDPGPAV